MTRDLLQLMIGVFRIVMKSKIAYFIPCNRYFTEAIHLIASELNLINKCLIHYLNDQMHDDVV
jgi:hypothetical protein